MFGFLQRGAFTLALSGAVSAATVYQLQSLAVCPGCGSLASGINDSGTIAGSVYDATGAHAFFGQPGAYTIFDQPGAMFTEAIGVNNAGLVTVNYFNPDGSGRAYLLAPDGARTFLPIVDGAAATLGGNVNLLGTAVGFYRGAAGSVRAYVDSGNTLSYTFDYPGALITQALGINDAGVIVGDYLLSATGLPHGFIRSASGVLSPFDIPDSIGTSVYGINNAGVLAGGYIDGSGREHGFVYEDGVISTIDFGNASTNLFAINNLGQVAGASFPDGGLFTGPYGGFVGTPVPEPGDMAFLAGLFTFVLIIGKRA